MPPRFQGQVIAVTSADQGYGRLLSLALARAGASVVLIGDNSETLAAHASTLEQHGGVAIPIQANISVPSDWLSAHTRILEIFGSLSGVIHLADYRAHTHFGMLSETEWMDIFSHNLKSTIAITQHLQNYSPATWLTLIGPHLDETGMQAGPQRGAMRGLTEYAQAQNYRLNLIFPGRASSNSEQQDAALIDAALMLCTPEMQPLRGNVLEVPMPPAVNNLHNPNTL